MKNKNQNETKALIWAVIMISIFVFGITISMNVDARAVGQYDFPPKVTMDVEMTNGANGTYQCPDVSSVNANKLNNCKRKYSISSLGCYEVVRPCYHT